jgi:hypothetical protein
VACPQHPGCDFVWSCLTCPNRRGPGATKLTIRYTAYLIAITFGASGIALEFNQLWQTASIFFMFGFVVVTAVLVQWLMRCYDDSCIMVAIKGAVMTVHTAEDGTVRQDHYGDGRQPWDDIVDAHWGPAFAAGNVLKYLRRTKDPKHSLESARWYWARLREFSGAWGDDPANAPLANDDFAPTVLRKLWEMLTPDERERL